MNILIVSATQFEVKPLLDYLNIKEVENGINKSSTTIQDNAITILITGIGMVNTAYMMGKYNKSSYDLVINVGVCGSFKHTIELGELVHVTEDVLSELGAENGEAFLTYDELNLEGSHIFKNQNTSKNKLIHQLKEVKGITVNTIHGNEASILKVSTLYNPDIESMEGAAFFAACHHNINNFLQIRAVSNYVETRDKSKWKMPLAIENLNNFLITLLNNDLKN
jgi:futalosine hydrolase